jgi:micrococcal nuclease
MPHVKRFILASAALALVAGSIPVAHKIISPGEYVTEVVDGDTFFIQANHQAIRVYGVDAPELGNCFSQEAKITLSRLILHKHVLLKEPLTDNYGRIMALVYVNGLSVNEYLVKNGFALYRREGGSETAAMAAANDFARTNKIGIYSPDCYQLNPPDPKCNIKGNINDRTGKKEYYTPQCGYYVQVWVEKFLGEQWFCSEKAAVSAGWSQSPTCK